MQQQRIIPRYVKRVHTNPHTDSNLTVTCKLVDQLTSDPVTGGAVE